MDLIVKKSKELIEHYTPHSIAFYTSGQLFLEEYHTLAMIGKGGLGYAKLRPLFARPHFSPDFAARSQNAAHGRQHPTLHSYRSRLDARELWLRLAAWFLHRLRT